MGDVAVGPMPRVCCPMWLDDSGWRTLHEGDSVSYRHAVEGSHQLMLSNPCTGTHQPSVEILTVVADSIVTVPVPIPVDCE